MTDPSTSAADGRSRGTVSPQGPGRNHGQLLSLALVLFGLAVLWVPINPELVGFGRHYYDADLWREPALRALPGTVASHLGASPGGFIVGILLFELLWIFLILEGLHRPQSDAAGDPRRSNTAMRRVVLLGSLFVFNSVVSSTHAIGGTVDVVAFALILVALRLCEGELERPLLGRLAAVALCLMAVLVHEKTVLDLMVLGVWLVWKQGWRRNVAFAVPVATGVLLALVLLGGGTTATPSPSQYWEALSGSLALGRSLNLWGVFMAGGMLWVLLAVAAKRFLRRGGDVRAPSDRYRWLVVLSMIGPCFLPLLVAVDTSRMVNGMWLPTFLLARDVDLAGMMGREVALRNLVIVLCLLQLLLPPLFVYKQRAVPLNCYSERVLRRLTGSDGLLDLPYPLRMRTISRPDITLGNHCWPPIRRAQ